MIDKFLRETVKLVVGKQAEEIVGLLDKDKFVNEFLVAKKLDITVNQARNILYKLSDQGLVSYTRKKDEKKGWYTYFWKIEIMKTLVFWENVLLERIGEIQNQIKSRETKLFYVCEKCNLEFNEENALLHNFICPECGEVFTLKDNSKLIREFKKNLEKYELELKEVREDISKIRDKEEENKKKEEQRLLKEKNKKRKAKKTKQKKPQKKQKFKKSPKKRIKSIKVILKKKKQVKKPARKPKKKIKKERRR